MAKKSNVEMEVGPNMGRGTSGLKDTLGSAMAQTSMRLGAPKKDKEKEEKPKAKKSETKKLKDTSSDYWSPTGTGDIGSASGEVGADMGQVNKGGYDASEGMKRGGSVRSSASARADGCAIRGKTRA